MFEYRNDFEVHVFIFFLVHILHAKRNDHIKVEKILLRFSRRFREEKILCVIIFCTFDSIIEFNEDLTQLKGEFSIP